MRYRSALIVACVVALAAPAFAADKINRLSNSEKKSGWELLFDGKSLDGWEGDPDVWSVRDGLIVGSTENKDLETNTFLIYRDEEFADFHLVAEMKLRNHNSGIQFRSEDTGGFVVKGYQADAAEGNWWGSLYGEKTGRGVIQNGWEGKGETVVKPGEWNRVEVICQGEHITIKLNGLTTVELDDDMSAKGILALQVHRGPKMEVSFRNLKIKKD